MSVTAADVKALRDRTGAGMMECKRALEEAERRRREGGRDPARQGPGEGGQARRARGRARASSRLRPLERPHRRARRGQLRDGLRRAQRRVQAVRARHRAPRRRGGAALGLRGRRARPTSVERELAMLRGSRRTRASRRRSSKKIAEGRLRKWLEEVVLLEAAARQRRQARGPHDRAAAGRASRPRRARTS